MQTNNISKYVALMTALYFSLPTHATGAGTDPLRSHYHNARSRPHAWPRTDALGARSYNARLRKHAGDGCALRGASAQGRATSPDCNNDSASMSTNSADVPGAQYPDVRE